MSENIKLDVAEAIANGLNELGYGVDVPNSKGEMKFEGNSHECLTIAEYMMPEITRLTQMLDEAEKGLEFYANGEHLNSKDHDEIDYECEGSRMTDHIVGKTARETLAKIKAMKESK